MFCLSLRASAASVTTKTFRLSFGGRALAPMLPAFLCGVIFLAGLASPFIVALLAG
jgi:hypothetical protein